VGDPCELPDTGILLDTEVTARKTENLRLWDYAPQLVKTRVSRGQKCGWERTWKKLQYERMRKRENKNEKEEWIGEYCARETNRWTCIDMRFKVHARAGSPLEEGEGGSSHLHRRRHAEWQSKAWRPAAIN